jgi:hypothetical protein
MRMSTADGRGVPGSALTEENVSPPPGATATATVTQVL